jgi:tellurite resistance protein TehA-like permease
MAAPRLDVRELPPNIFAVVMATGIVSLAAKGSEVPGLPEVAHGLFWLNVGMYAVLWGLLLARCRRHRDLLRDDLRNLARAPGFFTVVAATSVLGSQCVLLHGAWQAALGLWCLALLLWLGLTYGVLPGLMAVDPKPPPETGLSGVWLLTVVATQSLCVLGCRIAVHLPEDVRAAAEFAGLGFWLVGGMLYVWLIALIFYRIIFLPLSARELAPPYWINMGAMAISTLAGVALIQTTESLPLLAELLPFVKGVTLLFWATATWWIPLLLALGAWRHLAQRFPLRYEHSYWAAVFPLGMYTVCTQNLVRTLSLPFLKVLPDVFVWVALAAWAATFAGLVYHVWTRRKPA